MLIWNLMHSILPVISSLKHKIPDLNLVCARCGIRDEDNLYLFRDCSSSKVLWNMIFKDFAQPRDFYFLIFTNATWETWLNNNLTYKASWRVIFGLTTWQTWTMRNKVVFDGLMHNANSIYNRFKLDLVATNNVM